MVLETLRVHAPSKVIFVCGGSLPDKITEPVKSLRDAFLRVLDKSPLSKFAVYMAEDPKIFSPIGEYIELLKFEADIAQLTELLLLFCESPGSLVELGMFVVDTEVSPKLLAVIDDKNYAQESFIKLGPLFSLKHRHGDDTVCVLNLKYLNLTDAKDLAKIDGDKLIELLKEPLKRRLAERREPTSFDKTRHGHITKLITGLVQHYGSLTVTELDVLLYCLNISVPRTEIKRHIQCAERFGWLHLERIGTDDYCAVKPAAQSQAIDYELKPGSPIKGKVAWRAAIREHWKKTDPVRFSVISKAMATGLS